MLHIFNFFLITFLFIFADPTVSYTSSVLMSENFEDKNNLKVADYNENWTIEKLNNGISKNASPKDKVIISLPLDFNS